MGTPERSAAQMSESEWNDAYDEAVQWRDWQTCEILLDEREKLPWFQAKVKPRAWWWDKWTR